MSDVLPGNRYTQADGTVLEFTVDGVWAPVCAVCDAAMAGRDGAGRLCCAACGGAYPEAVKIG